MPDASETKSGQRLARARYVPMKEKGLSAGLDTSAAGNPFLSIISMFNPLALYPCTR